MIKKTRRARNATDLQWKAEETLRATLLSIGDAVISTDMKGLVAVMNPVAESLTGWSRKKAVGQPLETVFRIINAHTRQPVESPVAKVLKSGKITGLANHTLLIKRNGQEIPIADSGAPIRNEAGDTTGVVLVFRDQTRENAARKTLEERDTRFQKVLGVVPDMISIHSPEMDILYSNWQGYAAVPDNRRILHTKCHKTYRNLDDTCPDCLAISVLETRKPFHKETRLLDGKWLDIRVIPILDKDGDVEMFVEWVRDITDSKQSEEELKSNYAMLQIAGETARFGGWDVDLEKYISHWSDTVADIHEVPHGYAPPVEEGINFYAPEWRDKITQVFTACAEKGIPYDEEMEIITSKGKRVRVRTIGRAVKDENGRITKVQGSFQDITERKQAEEALRESEDRFKKLASFTFEGIVIHRNALVIDVNQSTVKLLGYERKEMVGMNLFKLIHPDFHASVKDNLQKQVATPYQILVIRKDGSTFYAEIEARDIAYNDEFFRVACIRDITQRKQAEEQLKESEERFRALHNASFGGIAIHDKGLILDCNQGLSEITGYSLDELIGMDGLLLIAPETRDLVMNNILAGYEKPYEAVGLRKNGESYPIRLEARNIPYKGKTVRTVEFRDLTESKRTQEALKRIEWMLSKQPAALESDYVQPYGDLSQLNTGGLILDSVGKDVLKNIASDFLRLLESSSAVYEKNGDYALGIFASGWCRFMDQASRELCGTDDNKEAMACGKWLCHDCCWKEASLPAMESGRPVDIECQGGIHLYASPIFAGDEVIGAVNFGYGDPPRDKQKLEELAEKYRVPLDVLTKKAEAYESRPAYIIETAKERLQASVHLIGEIVSRRIMEKKILTLNERLEQNIAEKTRELRARIRELERFHDATIQREFRVKELRDEIERLKKGEGKT
ncbi:MAG: PAS domain S-box protein [Candidatus Aminicenantes bacterium]|nr:PAS domain S-box protein [Candidatus Aminicenantes bacterium]